MKILAPAFLALSVMGTVPATQTIDYRFDDVRRSVVLTGAKGELHVQRGDRARSGDQVRTGWFSYALIASDHYRARFEIFSSTHVHLTGGTPGVILSLDRGRLHAIFDKITGDEPRVVQTPGALLAVRGTQYTVDVDEDGHTKLDVFEGTVEVRSRLRPEPFLVHAGEESIFSRLEPPLVHPMPPDMRQPGRGGETGHGDPHGGEPQPRGMGPQGAPPPPPGAAPQPKPGGHH